MTTNTKKSAEMQPPYIQKLSFLSGQSLELGPRSKLIVVGANNAGKTTMLEELRAFTTDYKGPTVVLAGIRLHFTVQEAMAWIRSTSLVQVRHDGHEYITSNDANDIRSSELEKRLAIHLKSQDARGIDLGAFITQYIPADGHSHLIRTPERLEPGQHYSDPIQMLQNDAGAFAALSAVAQRTFGMQLTLNHAYRTLRIHCGSPPEMKPGWDRISPEYAKALDALPQLGTQGHGVRAFVGIALYTMASPKPVLIIDEPEAHLHPPQANLLGKTLASLGEDKQMFIATHSGIFLRGLLDDISTSTGSREPQSAKRDVSILRLAREHRGPASYRVLSVDDVRKLWRDPLLRYSNILDGLFHEAVVVCESDGDCRFYSAILDHIVGEGTEVQRPDVLFLHCGGKDRLKVAVSALRAVGVRATAVADFDVLNDRETLQELCHALGMAWTDESEKNWRRIDSAVKQGHFMPSGGAIKNQIREILHSSPDSEPLTLDVADRIREKLPKKISLGHHETRRTVGNAQWTSDSGADGVARLSKGGWSPCCPSRRDRTVRPVNRWARSSVGQQGLRNQGSGRSGTPDGSQLRA